MRVETVHAHAFGPFTDERLDLAPGFTVVHGPNEAGKSTWLAALYAGLCGMRRGPGGVPGEDREFRARHEPWDGDRWEVGVVIELADGRRVELRQDLGGRVESRALDLATGRDISNEIMGDGAPDGARFLGLDRRTLPRTICVRQADVLGITDEPGALQEHLQRAAATAGSDATVEEALRRIASFRSAHVGLERRNSTRPLQQAIDRLAATDAALEEARHAHADYLELLADAEEAERRAGVLERRAEAARPMLGGREIDALRAFEQRPPAPDPLEGPSADELREELDALPDDPDGETEAAPEVVEHAERWRGAIRAADEHAAERPGEGTARDGTAPTLTPDPDPGLDPDLESRLADVEAEAKGRGPRPIILAAAVVLGVMGLTLMVLGLRLLGGLLAAAGIGAAVIAFVVDRRDRPDEREVAELGARLADQQRQRAWRERASQLDRRCTEASSTLRRALETRGIEVAGEDRGSLRAALDAYRQACRERAEQARLAARREDLSARLEARRTLEASVEAARRRRAEVERALLEAAVRIDAPVAGTVDPEELAVALRCWLEEREAGSSELEREARGARELAATLRGRVTDRGARMPSVSEAEEARERAAAELARVRRLGATLDRTREHLEQARDRVHRDVAPRLASAVSDRLRRVTDGRYDEVAVDPASLEVRVRAPGGRWRDAALLSHGTAEQIHLLLRVAMAEQIVTTGEPAPLLLDDVTVQADDERTIEMLELLLELSAERQVVLFSQESVVAEWAGQRLSGPDHRYIRLDRTRVDP